MLFEADKIGNFLFGPLDITLPESTTICISGASGSGKSVLLRCLADLQPHTGEMRLEGIACSSMSAPDWRRQVGLLPAEPAWWHRLVGDHFRVPEEAGFSALGFPSEVVSWETERLSSGEKQRLSLLRLLQNRPKVLLLDEPTANLDSKSTAQVEAYLGNWQQRYSTGIIWVSHNQEQIDRVADIHLVMSSGQLQEVVT